MHKIKKKTHPRRVPTFMQSHAHTITQSTQVYITENNNKIDPYFEEEGGPV